MAEEEKLKRGVTSCDD